MGREGNANAVDEQGGWWYAQLFKIKDNDYTGLYFCTDPGVMRWNPSIGVALAAGGYFLSEKSARKAVEKACRMYEDIDPDKDFIEFVENNNIWFKQIKTADGLKALQDLNSE